MLMFFLLDLMLIDLFVFVCLCIVFFVRLGFCIDVIWGDFKGMFVLEWLLIKVEF